MPTKIVVRSTTDIADVSKIGDPRDSRKAGWKAIQKGSEVIRDIQDAARTRRWIKLEDALPYIDSHSQRILDTRIRVIEKFKQAPHHARGYRMSRLAGTENPRDANCLCLISGHEGQEIPGMVDRQRVVVDAEHMNQALGPATIDEIFRIRKRIGEHVYISTNVSESLQLVRNGRTGTIDSRSTAALTSSKVLAAIQAGADVIKVGFANLDYSKRDLGPDEVARQLQLTRDFVDSAIKERAVVMPLNRTGKYPLIAVFFPEIGIKSIGDRPLEIARMGIQLAADGGWQGVLIDTYDKLHGKRYPDYLTVDQTAELAEQAHRRGLELWIAGSIRRSEIGAYVKAKVDLICFGGAARHPEGVRTKSGDEAIKRTLVEGLVAEFSKYDPIA